MSDILSIPNPTGATRLYALLGDPIAQVKGPSLMNQLFAKLGTDAIMVPMHVRPEALQGVVAALRRIENMDGMMVTIPHKFAVCDAVERLSPAVQLAGSANALRRAADGAWEADNFDGRGFVAGLEAQGHNPAGQVIGLVGSGGAGVSIAAALVEAGAAAIRIRDVRPEQSERLVRRLNAHRAGVAQLEPEGTDWRGTHIMINATPLGLRLTDPLPFDPLALAGNTLIADIIMKPRETRLLQLAEGRGMPVFYGEHMLSHQIEMYRRFFFHET
ncbi:shikimate dehydrogenase [Castellaniella sp. GW247-6E4]|uniref:shikimate dehydrogenase family protein n=1 Tax=Castellaniella sp. GW247-6E4 TaxID=3140380 RepID=UPI003314B4A2